MSSSLILHNKSKPFLLLIVTCDKSGFYTTTGNDQLSGWTEKFQSQTCTKEWSGSLFGGLLPVLSTTDFWIPVKPLHLKYARQIHKMYQKLKCLQLALVNRMGPVLDDNIQSQVAQPMLQKLNELCYRVLPCSSAIFTWPLANLLSLLQGSRQLFAEKMLPQPAGGRKCFF